MLESERLLVLNPFVAIAAEELEGIRSEER